jgi:hypothetical protein
MFDDESDYGSALQRYYADTDMAWDPTWPGTRPAPSPRYAQAHPHEDWAETFAHDLHLVDLVDTAVDHGLIPATPEPGDELPTPANALAELLALWRPVGRAIDAAADTVGAAHTYPFDPAPAVIDKRAYVHARVTARRTTRRPERPGLATVEGSRSSRRGRWAE